MVILNESDKALVKTATKAVLVPKLKQYFVCTYDIRVERDWVTDAVDIVNINKLFGHLTADKRVEDTVNSITRYLVRQAFGNSGKLDWCTNGRD